MGAVIGLVILGLFLWVVIKTWSEPGGPGCLFLMLLLPAIAILTPTIWGWYTSRTTTENARLETLDVGSQSTADAGQAKSARTVYLRANFINLNEDREVSTLAYDASIEVCPVNDDYEKTGPCQIRKKPYSFSEYLVSVPTGGSKEFENRFVVTGVPDGHAVFGTLTLVRACSKDESWWCER